MSPVPQHGSADEVFQRVRIIDQELAQLVELTEAIAGLTLNVERLIIETRRATNLR